MSTPQDLWVRCCLKRGSSMWLCGPPTEQWSKVGVMTVGIVLSMVIAYPKSSPSLIDFMTQPPMKLADYLPVHIRPFVLTQKLNEHRQVMEGEIGRFLAVCGSNIYILYIYIYIFRGIDTTWLWRNMGTTAAGASLGQAGGRLAAMAGGVTVVSQGDRWIF